MPSGQSCREAIGAQIVEALAITAWAGGLSAITFFVLMKFGKLRVDEDTEDAGIDMRHHSPSKAYAIGNAPPPTNDATV